MNNDVVIIFRDPENSMVATKTTISDVVKLEQRIEGDEHCVVLLFEETLEIAERVKEVQAEMNKRAQRKIEEARLEKWKAAVQ